MRLWFSRQVLKNPVYLAYTIFQALPKKQNIANSRRYTLLGFVFGKSLRQLIRARRIVAALDAGKRSDYFVDGFTDAKSLDTLQIARAAADEFQVCQNVVVDRKNYFS